MKEKLPFNNNERELSRKELPHDEIFTFIKETRESVEEKHRWLETCKKAEAGLRKRYPELIIPSDKLEEAWGLFDQFIEKNPLPLGHERGHIEREKLYSLALASKLMNASLGYPVEIPGLLFAGPFHDIGNAKTNRYHENQYPNGHGEIGAYLVFNILKNKEKDFGFSEDFLRLVAYSIASHFHHLKGFVVEYNGKQYSRNPYQTHFSYDEKDKLICGLPVFTRFVDRFDVGVFVHYPRHLLAFIELLKDGKEGQDRAEKFYDINYSVLENILNPYPHFYEKESLNKSVVTLLDHVGQFANSGFGTTIYSQQDHMFPPAILNLFGQKVLTVRQFETTVLKSIIEFINNKELKNQFNSQAAVKELGEILHGFSLAPKEQFNSAWEFYTKEFWPKVDPEVQYGWLQGFKKAKEEYPSWLKKFVSLTEGTEYHQLAVKIYNQLLSPFEKS